MGTGATVVFTADLSQVYQAYAQFLAYVRANPPQVQFGGGPGGAGGGPTYITNNYYIQNYNAGAGGQGGGGGGGGQGGSGGGGRGSYGGLGRYLGAAFLTREVLRAADSYVSYQSALSGATGPLERLKAEQALQNHLYSLPIVGQVAQLATAGSRLGTDQVVQQAQEQARHNDLIEESLRAQRRERSEYAAYGAGAPGSYGYRREEIEARGREERGALRGPGSEEERRFKEIERQKQLDISQAGSKTAIDYLKLLFTAGGVVEFGAALAGAKGPKEKDAEAEARKRADESKAAVSRDIEARLARQREVEARIKAEQDYQREQETIRARGGADVERFQYERKFNVADAAGIYNAGRGRVEAERHRENPEAARAEAEATTYRLLQLQYKLQFGGDAQSADISNIDFGQGSRGYIQGDPLKLDDIQEALGQIREYLAAIAKQTEGL